MQMLLTRPELLSRSLGQEALGACVVPTVPSILSPQVRLGSRLLLHGGAMSGPAGAQQRPGPADRRRGQRGLLDLHRHLHPLPKVKAVMPKEVSQKQKCPPPLDPPFPSSAKCSLGLFSFSLALPPASCVTLLFSIPLPPHGSVTLLCAPNVPRVSCDSIHIT